MMADDRRPKTFEQLKKLKPEHEDFEDIWNADKEAQVWWAKFVEGKRKPRPNQELVGALIKYFKKTNGKAWPEPLVRRIVRDCIDLRTPDKFVGEVEFRCFVNMWGPFKNIMETITQSLYDKDGKVFPYWAGKKGREHFFENIGDYVIRFATSRFHLAASWKKVKAGTLVIKHVAIWRSAKGFFWVPQTNGPLVGYFKTLRELIRDFDHTLRNPGCSDYWYSECFENPWMKEDVGGKKKEKTEEDNIYVMLDDNIVERHKRDETQRRTEKAKEARKYYQRHKLDEECYAWDSACSPTVTGGHFRAMMPSRALGVESTSRLNNGFSDAEFEADKKAREKIIQRKTVPSQGDLKARAPGNHVSPAAVELPEELPEGLPEGLPQVMPSFLRADSCAVGQEIVEGKANVPLADSTASPRSPAFKASARRPMVRRPKTSAQPKPTEDNIYSSLVIKEEDKEDSTYASGLATELREKKEGKEEESTYAEFLVVDAPTRKNKTLKEKEENEEKAAVFITQKPTFSRGVSLAPVSRKVFKRKRYKFDPFDLEKWLKIQSSSY